MNSYLPICEYAGRKFGFCYSAGKNIQILVSTLLRAFVQFSCVDIPEVEEGGVIFSNVSSIFQELILLLTLTLLLLLTCVLILNIPPLIPSIFSAPITKTLMPNGWSEIT